MRMREPSSVESTNYSHTQIEIQTMLEVSSSGDNVHSAPPFFPLSPSEPSSDSQVNQVIYESIILNEKKKKLKHNEKKFETKNGKI